MPGVCHLGSFYKFGIDSNLDMQRNRNLRQLIGEGTVFAGNFYSAGLRPKVYLGGLMKLLRSITFALSFL